MAMLPEDDQPVSLIVPDSKPVVLAARLRGRWRSVLGPEGFQRVFMPTGVMIEARVADGGGRTYRRRLRPGWTHWWFLRAAADICLDAQYAALRAAA